MGVSNVNPPRKGVGDAQRTIAIIGGGAAGNAAARTDLVIVANGTVPSVPASAPRTGLAVDERLRTDHTAPIYAAGGVALHHFEGGSLRIDHWDHAAAQGTHATRSLLHDLGAGDDPGPYRSSSRYSVRIHGTTIAGAGVVKPGAVERTISNDPLLTEFATPEGTPIGVVGVNAAHQVLDWSRRSHST